MALRLDPQDGASCHRAKLTTKWLADRAALIEVVKKWPANSPDLSPVENMWALVSRELANTEFSTIDELQASIAVAWGSIARAVVCRLCESYAERLYAVQGADGAWIRY